MNGPSPIDAFARAAAALVQDHDAADVLANLAGDACEALAARAVGIILRSARGEFEVLTATSHRTVELEMFQAQQNEGPCVDCVRTASPVHEDGSDAIASRWPVVGPQIVAAGFGAVRAFPLRWHGSVLGALNVFLANGPEDEAASAQLGQAFADVTTLVILSSHALTSEQVARHVQQALAARAVVEQAKGVLAYVEHLGLDAAYDRLRTIAAERGQTLTVTAHDVIAGASRRLDGPNH